MTATTSRARISHAFADVSGLRIHCAHLPSNAKPMVMLHGIGMDWRVWQALSRRLSPSFDLYMVDLRGHGQSDKPSHGYSLAHYAADIEDLIDQLQLVETVLVGSSLGAMVTAVIEAPKDLVSHRVLVDPPLANGRTTDQKMFRDILRLKHEPVKVLAAYLATYNPKASPYYLRTMSEMWHEASDGVIEDLLLEEEGYYAIEPALPAIDAPTLLLQADPRLGGVLSREQAERALQLLPRGSLAYFEGAGHAIHAAKPDEFVDIVREFVGVA